MPGVEVHATAFLNLLRGDALERASSAVESLIVVGVAGIAGIAFVRLRPAPATVAALAVGGPGGADGLRERDVVSLAGGRRGADSRRALRFVASPFSGLVLHAAPVGGRAPRGGSRSGSRRR